MRCAFRSLMKASSSCEPKIACSTSCERSFSPELLFSILLYLPLQPIPHLRACWRRGRRSRPPFILGSVQFKIEMAKRQEFAYSLKILLIGNSGVGKSCLLLRFSDDKFQSNLLNTIGVDFKMRMVDCEGERVKLVLWDTAGQERFRTITNSYYRSASGIIIVYDITDRESFENVYNWYNEMNKNIDQKVGCWIVGNKLDMSAKRVVSYEEGLALANKYQVPFMETSAKTSHNVSELFEGLTKQIVRLNKGSNKASIRRPPLPITNPPDDFCKCCN